MRNNFYSIVVLIIVMAIFGWNLKLGKVHEIVIEEVVIVNITKNKLGKYYIEFTGRSDQRLHWFLSEQKFPYPIGSKIMMKYDKLQNNNEIDWWSYH